jgi:arginyl-tRNA synthetase
MKGIMKEKLVALVQTAGKNLGFSFEEVHFEHPETLAFGDYSTNIALVYAKKLGLNPRDLAAKIQQEIEKDKPDFLSHTEVAGAGFINFFLSTKFFVSTLKEIVEDKNFASGKVLAGKNVLFEYTDPNPFKEFHIGHLMANSIGEALSRVAETQGAKVTRVCYQGDIGLHVAKTVWAMRQARGQTARCVWR